MHRWTPSSGAQRVATAGKATPEARAAAFRVLGKIAKLEVFETETFPAEEVKVFWKALV